METLKDIELGMMYVYEPSKPLGEENIALYRTPEEVPSSEIVGWFTTQKPFMIVDLKVFQLGPRGCGARGNKIAASMEISGIFVAIKVFTNEALGWKAFNLNFFTRMFLPRLKKLKEEDYLNAELQKSG